MKAATRQLWERQDQHKGDRKRLFTSVRTAVGGKKALYPGSFVDVAASFAYPSVTYVDYDRRTRLFFNDTDVIQEIIASETGSSDAEIEFIHTDYREELGLEHQSFDILISLYAGLVSDSCTNYLKIGGTLLVNPSHGDTAMASIDPRYKLAGVVESRSGNYRVRTDNLDQYLEPKRQMEVNAELIRQR